MMLAFTFGVRAQIIISTNVIWTPFTAPPNPVNGIVINPGGSLTITGGHTVQLINHIRVLTNTGSSGNGGRLIVNGATIESGSTWGAWSIMVIGNPSYSQQDVRMAKATYTNSSFRYLHHAGVNYDFSNPPSNTYGGIITAGNCVFYDNRVSIQLEHYQNFQKSNPSIKLGDFSNFGLCTFSNDVLPFYTRMYLHEVEGVGVRGCTFSTSTSIGGKLAGHKAIWLDNAGVNVDVACSGAVDQCLNCQGTTTANQFNDMTYGVYGTGLLGSHRVNVLKSNFNNCLNGVYLFAYQNPFVLQNRFNLYPDFSNKHNGIALEGSTGFRVEENNIRTNGAGSSSLAYGIEITDAGQAYNDVYLNTVRDANYALQANDRNRSSTFPLDGLKFLCNNMSNVVLDAYDITVTGPIGPLDAGIGQMQAVSVGGTLHTAGNYFSAFSSVVPDQNFDNPPNPLSYYVTPGDITTYPIDYTPSEVNPTFGASRYCPSRLGCGGSSSSSMAPSSYTASKTQLESQIDGSTGAMQAGYLADYRQLANQMLAIYDGVYDSAGASDPAASVALLGDLRYSYDYRLMKACREAGQGLYMQAQATIQSIPGAYTLSPAEAQRTGNVGSLISIAAQLDASGGDWQALPAADRTQVADIAASDDSWARYMARHYLSKYEQADYAPNLVLISADQESGAAFRKAATGVLEPMLSNVLSVHPNPAKDFISISGLGEARAEATLTDLSGRVVAQAMLEASAPQISLTGLPAGIYLLKLQRANGEVSNFKIVKQ